MRTVWFIALVATICFEGLGRKFMPGVPTAAFYFAKDAILIWGLVRFRPTAEIRRTSRHLYRGYQIFLGLAVAWTVLQVFNPEHKSGLLAVIGVRSYWLWWLAPMLIAHVLRDPRERLRAIYVLIVVAAVVSLFAVLEFLAPSQSGLNVYSYVDGEAVGQVLISETGRARVSSTFSFISGFSDFTILVPTLILSFGLDARDPRLRKWAFVVTGMTAAVLPMSGSRLSLLLGGGILFLSFWSAGLFFTRVGRRMLVGSVVAAIGAVVAFPDAFIGIQSRFENQEETNSRYMLAAAAVLPPLAIATVKHPPFGIGTGMLQNARVQMKIPLEWEAEQEFERYLLELGTVGFIVMWLTKFGLMVALYRAYQILKRAGRRGAATASLSYAVLTLIGNLTFDHIWQSLYFIGCGFVLAEVVSVMRARAAVRTAPPAQQSAAPQALQPAAAATP
jgi:hypothetical protein